MGRKRKAQFPQQASRHISLENENTNNTIENLVAETVELRRATSRTRKEKVDPPFKSTEKIWTFGEFMYQLGFTGKIVAIVISFVFPAVWYVSKLDSNVDTLKTDVRDVKDRIVPLEKTSALHDGKLETLEKTFSKNAEPIINTVNK